MEIKFLKKYKDFKDLKKDAHYSTFGPPRGFSDEEITKIEKDLNNGNSLPQAYKEFLAIGGKFNSIQLDDYKENYLKAVEYYKEKAAKRRIVISRPIAIIHNLDGALFSFIYLDEGDNPQPWNLSTSKGYDTDDGEILYKMPFKTFKDLVEKLVYLSENGLSV
ncbi:SMI1/KNR4 family protein [Flavobacterium terrae]|uniref:Knr4/Smi1-like domain-containing protein n=1 Tax=Flavobacterium terrae TaxID=415425 RepID=A0A1M6AZQ3_9FLAO|nr:SMI1/KNR4 family protein [Flavobacterium terrae]SHI41703.1 hypothetical protein SAMN05444363_0476 [Flavobacterium terrae]